jgi:hypothetical protein
VEAAWRERLAGAMKDEHAAISAVAGAVTHNHEAALAAARAAGKPVLCVKARRAGVNIGSR